MICKVNLRTNKFLYIQITLDLSIKWVMENIVLIQAGFHHAGDDGNLIFSPTD